MAKAKLFDRTKLPFDYGTQESVSVKSSNGGVLIAKLADGTILEIKTILIDVKRSKDRYVDNGDPVYAITAAPIITTKIPAKLKIKKVK